MLKKFEIGDLVSLLESLPFGKNIFKIVADKNNPWKKASPFSFESVLVVNGKDFILLMLQETGEFSTKFLEDNGLHVNASEIKFYNE